MISTIGPITPRRSRDWAGGAGSSRAGAGWEMRVDDVSLVYLRKVTNAAFEIAGLAVEIADGVRRVLPPNPDPMTSWATNTYILGKPEFAVVDPLPEIAAFCKREKLWFHVDGAYGAPAAALDEAPRQGSLHRCIRSHNTTKGRQRVAAQRQFIGRVRIAGLCQPAGIGVLDDHAAPPGQFGRESERRVEIEDVVEGERLAVQLPGGRQAGLEEVIESVWTSA